MDLKDTIKDIQAQAARALELEPKMVAAMANPKIHQDDFQNLMAAVASVERARVSLANAVGFFDQIDGAMDVLANQAGPDA
jgi:hypothetical protein